MKTDIFQVLEQGVAHENLEIREAAVDIVHLLGSKGDQGSVEEHVE